MTGSPRSTPSRTSRPATCCAPRSRRAARWATRSRPCSPPARWWRDELVIRLVEDRFAAPDAADGALLDGFPRNLAQAEALEDAPRRRRREPVRQPGRAHRAASPRACRRAGSARTAATIYRDTDPSGDLGRVRQVRRRRRPARRRPARGHQAAPRDLRARHRAAARLLPRARPAGQRRRRPGAPTRSPAASGGVDRANGAWREALGRRTGQDAQGRQGGRRDARGDARGDPPRASRPPSSTRSPPRSSPGAGRARTSSTTTASPR